MEKAEPEVAKYPCPATDQRPANLIVTIPNLHFFETDECWYLKEIQGSWPQIITAISNIVFFCFENRRTEGK
jgi:hypothetical protein